jgi:DNA-directed RNA polymerase subunit F
MVVKEEKPVSLAEVYDLIEVSDSSVEIRQFLKNLLKLNSENAKKLKDELSSLDLIKLRDVHIVKIIDFLPKDAIELNKILTDVSLEEGEICKILDVVNKY